MIPVVMLEAMALVALPALLLTMAPPPLLVVQDLQELVLVVASVVTFTLLQPAVWPLLPSRPHSCPLHRNALKAPRLMRRCQVTQVRPRHPHFSQTGHKCRLPCASHWWSTSVALRVLGSLLHFMALTLSS